MGVAYNSRIVTDGLVACYDLGNVFRNTTTYTTTNFLQNGSFAGGLGVTYAFADGAGSNPTNTIVELENPGDSNYVLRQNGTNTEYQMNIDSAGYGTLLSNTQYVMSGWYAKSSDYNGGDTMFHARAYSSSGANIATGTGIGTLLYSVEIGGLTWEYRYQTITTPFDHDGNFDWYMGYGTTNTTGYRYYTGLRVEEGSFPSLVDLSKNSTDATVFNGPSFTNSNGGYVTFDGIDDYIGIGATAGDLGIYDGDYTFEAWVYPTDISALSGDNFIFGTTQTSLRQGLHLGFRNTGIYQGHYSSDYVSGTVTANQWYHLAWTYEKNLGATNGTAKIYKNGQLQPNPGTINSWIGDTEILIGNALTASGRHFQGRGALFKIYNRALTSKEVLQNFDAQKVRYGTFDPEPTIVRDSLSLYYDANNNNSYTGYGTLLNDIASGENPGNLVGPIYNTDGYFLFDGVDDYISITDNLGNPQQFTIECWVYPSELDIDSNNTYRRILTHSGASSNNAHSLLIEENGEISFRIPGGSTNNFRSSGFTDVNQWGHIVCTYDQTDRKIYFNGTLRGTRNEPGVTVDFGSPAIVSPNNLQTFKGRIANFKIYSKALSLAEVQQNYDASKVRFIDRPTVVKEGLQVYLDAGNTGSYSGSGATWTDIIGERQATLNGSPTFSTNYFNFNGIDQNVVFPSSIEVSTAGFTMGFLMRVPDLQNGTGWNFMLADKDSGSGSFEMGIYANTARNFIFKDNDNPSGQQTVSTDLGSDWVYLTFGMNEDLHPWIYVNGQFRTRLSVPFTSATLDFTQLFSYNNVGYFKGDFSVVQLYNRALSAKEIQQNFEVLRGRFGI